MPLSVPVDSKAWSFRSMCLLYLEVTFNGLALPANFVCTYAALLTRRARLHLSEECYVLQALL